MGIVISQLGFARLAAARGWQAPVWFCFTFTAVSGVAYLLFYRDPAPIEEGHVSLAAGLRRLSPDVWKLGIIWMFWNAGAMVLLTFANDLLVGRGMSTQTAGLTAGILMVFPVGASSVMGHVLDRRGWQGQGLAVGCVLFAAFAILLGILKGSVIPLFLGISFTFALAPAGVFALAPYLMHGRESGLGYGVLAGLLNVGVLFGPAVGGVVRDATGSYLASFIMAGAFTCIGAACVALLRRSRTESAR